MTWEGSNEKLRKASSRTMMGRELVPLKPGETAPQFFSEWQPPEGYRWETDDEFAARTRERKAIGDMSDREFTSWFIQRMHEWVGELHAKGIEIPAEVSFGLGAAGGILARLTTARAAAASQTDVEMPARREP